MDKQLKITVGGKAIWTAFPIQNKAIFRDEFEVLFGGARGGSKTAAGIAWLLRGNEKKTKTKADDGYFLHPNYRALVLRRNMSDLGDWIAKAKQIYLPLGARYTARPCEFIFPSGATIVLAHLDDSDAFEKYQGQEFTRILIEELTQIPKEELYLRVMASCRSPFRELKPQIFLTCNPGGIGHYWVRERFVSPVVPETPYTDPETELSRIFIPAKVTDNPIYAKDKQYIGQLMSLPPNVRRAWLDGDWDAISGQYFTEFSTEKHVIQSEGSGLAPWFHRWLSVDWGYAHNAAVYKYCQEPNGRIHVCDELVLNHTTPEELGVEIGRFLWSDLRAGTATQQKFQLFLSPDAFGKRTDERTVADQLAKGLESILGVNTVYILPLVESDTSDLFSRASLQTNCSVMIQRASNQRVAGWSYMRTLMRTEPLVVSDDRFDPELAVKLHRESPQKAADYLKLFAKPEEIFPRMLIHGDKCPRACRAIPLAQAQDPERGDPEDVDKRHFDGMDEIDSLRYGLFAHKFLQLVEPFDSYFAKHMAQYAPMPLDQMDGNMKVWMARKAEAKYAELSGAGAKPIFFKSSRTAARRRSVREAQPK